MKKALIVFVLILGFIANAQSKKDYMRYGKLTTAEINAIDTTRTDVIYEAYNDDLGIKVINRRDDNGWVPLITAGAGSGDFLANGSVPMTGTLYTRAIIPNADGSYTFGTESNLFSRSYQYRSVWKAPDGEFWMFAGTTASHLGVAKAASSTGAFSSQYVFNANGPTSGKDLTTVEWVLANASGGTPTTDASELSTGTLPDARLSTNVPLKNASNLFTGSNRFQTTLVQGVADGVSGNRWAFGRGSGSTEFQFLYQVSPTTSNSTGYTQLYTLNESGTPADATDLIDKAALDAAIAGVGGGSDSGQTKIYSTGSSKTLVLTDFYEGGVLTGKGKIHYFTANDTLIVPNTLGQTGTVIRTELVLMGADSLYIKKDTGTILINGNLTYSGTGMSGDGVIIKANSIMDILPNGNVFIFSDAAISSYTEAAPARYNGLNAADPTNEVDGVANVTYAGGASGVSSNEQVQNGTRSVKVSNSTATSSNSYFALQNITAGDVVTVTGYIFRKAGDIGNIFVFLDDAQGWVSDVSDGISNTETGVWVYFELTGTAAINNPNLRFSNLSSSATSFYYVDNIAY